jgi:hypothetical protein
MNRKEELHEDPRSVAPSPFLQETGYQPNIKKESWLISFWLGWLVSYLVVAAWTGLTAHIGNKQIHS